MNDTSTAVIITAGGSGSRMGASVPKQFLKLSGRTILEQTVSRFAALPEITEIVLTVPAEHLAGCREMFPAEIRIVPGGSSRQASVGAAIDLLAEEGFPEDGIVLVQDGVRPYVTEKTIRSVLRLAEEHGAAIAAVPCTDTIRDREQGTLDRSRLVSVQTPQGFRFGLLREAYARAEADRFSGTDDAGLVERIGIRPVIAEGSPGNIKITTPEDLPMETRIGTGFDVHKLTENRKLILGGVEIPYEKGLLGHSDADVLLHALMDAMLGAAALGDIGRHFPDTDPAYEGASSMILLEKVTEILADAGYRLANADVTVICQKPKLAPYIDEMRQNIAEAAGTDVSRISVKATTTERLGFTGRGEGIAAEAVCTITNRL
ncbi:MAG: 2-C-methyl-D-erythritol 2,4-cyclodiphosphate synthase [Eubacterium sp.]|nr:2-C-methyl-D-erythritol 2,4-cyclodiphosphate synthase [Eubacterium sp.]